MKGIVAAWGRILAGYHPALAIEITRECPLRCPGCYAYGDDHLGGQITLRQVSDFKGQELIERVRGLVDHHRPLHLSIVGGEPLVRYRELNSLLPFFSARGIHVQLVTSAVREIPSQWRGIDRLSIVVSIDGLQAEHDARRAPATYPRILKHIAGHYITVHCTVTGQQARQAGYLEEFVRFWSAREETKQIWMSLYTPQIGEASPEKLTQHERDSVVADLLRLRSIYSKLVMPEGLLEAYITPPKTPSECIFAQTTKSVSADLKTAITPCMLGGAPDCENCGCMASAGLAAVARHQLLGVIPVGAIFRSSLRVGRYAAAVRERIG
ncbi:MAG: radical SAM protein [Blastocatellia bacterium]|nr:MAG: radical SAM protein [Blastocatellia bacterium]